MIDDRLQNVRLDPISLKFFISVVEQGSITAAAAREHISTAAMSKRISELEEVFQTQLLRRISRGVEPTSAGFDLLNLSRPALDGLHEVYSRMRDHSTGVRGRVRVVANQAAMLQSLLCRVASFLAAHAGVDVQLEAGPNDQAVKAVADGLADIAIATASTALHEDLRMLAYCRDRLALVVPSAHPLAGRASIPFALALDCEFVGIWDGAAVQPLLAKAAAEHGRPLKTRIRTTNPDVLCHMAHAGLGMGVVPLSVAAPYVKALHICAITLEDAWAERDLRIYVRSQDKMPVVARMLVEHLRAG